MASSICFLNSLLLSFFVILKLRWLSSIAVFWILGSFNISFICLIFKLNIFTSDTDWLCNICMSSLHSRICPSIWTTSGRFCIASKNCVPVNVLDEHWSRNDAYVLYLYCENNKGFSCILVFMTRNFSCFPFFIFEISSRMVFNCSLNVFTYPLTSFMRETTFFRTTVSHLFSGISGKFAQWSYNESKSFFEIMRNSSSIFFATDSNRSCICKSSFSDSDRNINLSKSSTCFISSLDNIGTIILRTRGWENCRASFSRFK